jgi:hypothetical protein
MEQVFKVMAFMDIQYQTMYIKASSGGCAVRAAIAHGAVSAEPVCELGPFAPFDFHA